MSERYVEAAMRAVAALERCGTGLLNLARATHERNEIERERLDAQLGQGKFAPTSWTPPKPEDRCTACGGSGMVSKFPAPSNGGTVGPGWNETCSPCLGTGRR